MIFWVLFLIDYCYKRSDGSNLVNKKRSCEMFILRKIMNVFNYIEVECI